MPYLILATIIGVTIYGYLSKFKRFKVLNYRGEEVFIFGFFLTSIITLLGIFIIQDNKIRYLLFLGFIVSLVGLIDDLFPSSAKGFKGHIKSLFEGRITTGLFKLIAVTTVSLIWSIFLNGVSLLALLDALIISACSNFFNLLDLRPGRSVKASLPIFLVALFVSSGEIKTLAILLIVAYLIYLVFDLSEKLMLGDAGSNALGFFAGTVLSILVKITLVKVFFAIVFVALNLVSERYSFTRLIEKNPFLNFIDRLGRR
ncbi:MAG: hypothetical protein N2440_05525 [Actinobacteria bacterium]|nr:hypothetical protein [Actinomycetota bacterium]